MDTSETLLTTASLAKLFTAIGVLQLQDRGQINLNEDVRPHLAEFELKTSFEAPLTFAHLLTHTDGFEFRMMGSIARTEDELLPLGEYVASYLPIQIYHPGENLTYSDFASNLAGYLTQEASGLPFAQYMAENILFPLGMDDSTFEQRLPQETRERIASGYDFVDGKHVTVPELYMNNTPAGGFRTTAADMNPLMLALLNGGEYQGTRILEPETAQMMFTRQFAPHPNMGGITYGLFEHLENGQQIFFRDGDAFGGFEWISQWVEVEPLYFKQVDGTGNIAFVEDQSGKVVRLISEQGYHGTFKKLPWYETQSFHMILVEMVAILLVSMRVSTFIIWPITAMIRKLRRQIDQNRMPWGAVLARLWAAVVSGLFLLLALRAIGVLYAIDAVAGIPNFVWGITPVMIESLQSLYLPAMLALALPVFAALAWIKSWWKVSQRMYYTLVILAVFAGFWWTHYWNLLGFRM